MARGVSSNDGDSGTDDTDAAVRVSGARLGPGIYMLNGDGICHLLLLLSNV